MVVTAMMRKKNEIRCSEYISVTLTHLLTHSLAPSFGPLAMKLRIKGSLARRRGHTCFGVQLEATG